MASTLKTGAWLSSTVLLAALYGCSSDPMRTSGPVPPEGTKGSSTSTAPPGTDVEDASPGAGRGVPDAGSDDGDKAAPSGSDRAQTAVLARLPGRAGDGCVAVGARRDVRSGSFGAGPFDDARTSYATQTRDGQPPQVRLYFIPAAGSAVLPGLTLSVENLSTGAEQTVRQGDTADADLWTYYDAQVPIPEPGRYRLRATSGDDSGCFLMEFS